MFVPKSSFFAFGKPPETVRKRTIWGSLIVRMSTGGPIYLEKSTGVDFTMAKLGL